MIKLKIFKGEKDESETVFIEEEGKAKEKLVFEVIKSFAKRLLVASINGEDDTYEINIEDDSLSSYKEIIKTVFDSTKNDEELKDLYKEVSQARKTQIESAQEDVDSPSFSEEQD